MENKFHSKRRSSFVYQVIHKHVSNANFVFMEILKHWGGVNIRLNVPAPPFKEI
jgi:hypothetical protein